MAQRFDFDAVKPVYRLITGGLRMADVVGLEDFEKWRRIVV